MALYENSTWEWNGQVSNVYSNWWYAQSFTPSVTHDISSVILALGRPVGDSPGTVTVSIRAISDVPPHVGEAIIPDLCSGTTDGDTVAELSGLEDTPTEREITFAEPATLTAGTQYAIVVRAPSGSSSNKLYWVANASSVYAGGVQMFSSTSGANGGWTLYADKELWFKEYGDPGGASKPVNPTPSDTDTGISINLSELSWESGGDTDAYDVYFNTGSGLVQISSNQIETSIDVSDFLPLTYGAEYSWRVDAVNNDYGTVTGDVWTFTALVFAPPIAATGIKKREKRLVAMAENRFWYEDI